MRLEGASISASMIVEGGSRDAFDLFGLRAKLRGALSLPGARGGGPLRLLLLAAVPSTFARRAALHGVQQDVRARVSVSGRGRRRSAALLLQHAVPLRSAGR